MSVITLQIGQCGNQIGGQLLNTIAKDCFPKAKPDIDYSLNFDYNETAKDRFFYEAVNSKNGFKAWTARAVLVDMESKVIEHTVADAKKGHMWSYSEKSQVSKKCGSGNNWSNGYNRHGPSMEEKIMNAIRFQTEKCDSLSGFMTLMSLAGGTGSGVGAYLSDCLREEYNKSFFVNQIVLPYSTGEVVVQNYNAILSLAHLYHSSDVILSFDNDLLQYICQKKLSIPKVSFYEINDIISRQLATIFLPYSKPYKNKPKIINSHICDFIQSIAKHPKYKLAMVHSAPHVNLKDLEFTTFNWPSVIKALNQSAVFGTSTETKVNWLLRLNAPSLSDKYLSRLLITRGPPSSAPHDLSKLTPSPLYPSWAPPSASFSERGFPRSFSNLDKSGVLVENGRGGPVLPRLDNIVQKAWDMFSSRAYIHQYKNYGMEEDDFVDCFAVLERVLHDYAKF